MREFWIKIIGSISEFLLKILYRLNKPSQNSKFRSLSPTTNIDNPEIYHEALDWALRNREAEDIKNIAITGYYGSGKSSVIKNFISHNSHLYKFLPISLATFKDENHSSIDSVQSIQEIEESILQQIFYKVPDSEIPNSRFNKIASNYLLKYFIFSVPMIVFLVLLFIFFVPKINDSLGWGLTQQQIVRALIISGAASIFLIFWKLKNLTLSKFSVKNLEVDLAEKNNELSVLNTYIDEIIYFFKKTKYQIVVIEDIDRFETTEIFTKLREINLILNNSEITKDLHIVFIYAIKDDQFKNKKDRTKFFDFILPVIPIINLNNSIDKILKIRDDYKLGISDKLVKELAIYIDDMRLLLNIFNEFLIYNAQIKDVSRDKLLAIIIYKNLLPDDFALLAQSKGLLYSIINKKRDIINDKIKDLKVEITELTDRNFSIQEHSLTDLGELRSLYLLAYIDSIKITPNLDFKTFRHGDSNESIEKMKMDDNFEALIKNKIQFVSNNYGLRDFGIPFTEIEKRVNETQSYGEREDLILKKSKNQLAINNRRITEIKSEIIEVNKSNLHEIISNSIIGNTLSNYLKAIAEDNISAEKVEDLLNDKRPLIQSLISNGFIDEDYFMYISIFYEERITRKDFQFIQNVKNSRNVEYDYELKNISEIIQFLNPRNLESEFIYNRDLTNFLLVNTTHSQEKNLLLDSIAKCDEPALNFITYFINDTANIKVFIKELTHRNRRLWDEILSNSIEDKTIEKLYTLILQYAELDSLVEMIEESSFGAQILNDEKILIRIDNGEKLKKIISKSGLKLEHINFSLTKTDLLDFVYNNNNYAFTKTMLLGFYNERIKESNPNFLRSPYSIIAQATELKNMFNYIQKNLNKYVNEIALLISENRSEEEPYYLNLLNSDDISIDNKIALIQKQQTIISDPSKIVDINLVDLLLKEVKILPTWPNIDYLSQEFSESTEFKKIPKQVAEFLSIEKISQDLQYQTIRSEEFSLKNFENLIINRIDIPDTRYAELISNFKAQDIMDLSGLDPSKIKILIQKEKLLLSEENLVDLRKKNSDIVILFLEQWKDEFILNVNDYILKPVELKDVLKSSKFKAAEKSRVLQSQTEIRISEDEELLVLIANLILDEKQFSPPVSVILELTKVNLKIDRSIKLFNKISGKFSKEHIRSFLENLKNPFRKLADSTSRPSIPKDAETTKMLETLESKGIISSKKIEGQKYRVYKPSK